MRNGMEVTSLLYLGGAETRQDSLRLDAWAASGSGGLLRSYFSMSVWTLPFQEAI